MLHACALALSGELDADDIEMLTDAVDALDARGALGRLKA
tara:strand:+ start:297 stop:416 length:120 start_codon:yes stop_codon:yes gene_type:complete